VTDRQQKIPGFDQTTLEESTVLLVGAGGLGGEVGHSLVRKGVGGLQICDSDIVMPSNLNRQRFYIDDLYKNKAVRLAKNLKKEATMKTKFFAYPMDFQRLIEEGVKVDCTAVACGVDNNPTRRFVAKYFHSREIPVVYTALSKDANYGYVFVQEPGKACFGCVFPDALDDETYPCGAGAVIDIVKVATGLATFAIDTLIMSERKRNWNLRRFFMSGFVPDSGVWAEKRVNCPICGER
jgi:molybdopterin/thiamine biosynthesis adenylyltransferase